MKYNSEVVLSCLANGELKTKYGLFEISVFYDGLQEAIVLTKGDLNKAERIYCRIHSECIASHIFLGDECDCVQQMHIAQKKIIQEGKGIIIFLHQEGRGNGVVAHVASQNLKKKFKMTQDEAYIAAGFRRDNRNYDIVGKLLKYYGVKSIQIDSHNKEKFNNLRQIGVIIENDES